ncbi:TRAP transporter small permease [Metallumcola ferriviriculae]|uniref:TRAP transporter small permease n=1 Tax=Metallumcola ferriviriculae TaxID=3039180 RepID=A0AAU0ULF1_9FIRM|nr:TRAP transporter small permease [Desulfitibacteraceae bacterium MK1]
MAEKKQSKFSDMLGKLETGLITVLLGGMTIVVFLQVFFRFVVKGSLPWSEELARYLMVWAVFIGASIGAREGAHIGVEAVVNVLPKRLKRGSIVVSGLLSVIFSIVVMVLSFQVIAVLVSTGQKSPAMQMPMYWAYLAIPVGSIFMAIRFFQAMVEKFQAPRGEG